METPNQKPTLTLREWVAALRSGEWQQGTGRLCSLDADGTKRYCCLGVALALQGRLNEEGGDIACTVRLAAAMPTADFLVEPVTTTWEDVDGDHFNISVTSARHDGKLKAVSELNDNRWSFDEIADALEHTYPQYFTDTPEAK